MRYCTMRMQASFLQVGSARSCVLRDAGGMRTGFVRDLYGKHRDGLVRASCVVRADGFVREIMQRSAALLFVHLNESRASYSRVALAPIGTADPKP